MEWNETSLYRVLNKALISEDRESLKIWFPYLNLFDTALDLLPTVNYTQYENEDSFGNTPILKMNALNVYRRNSFERCLFNFQLLFKRFTFKI